MNLCGSSRQMRLGHEIASTQVMKSCHGVILGVWKGQAVNMNVLGMVLWSSVQSLSHVWPFMTPWTAARQVPCPSPTPGACSNSCPSRRWCHPTVSPFDSHRWYLSHRILLGALRGWCHDAHFADGDHWDSERWWTLSSGAEPEQEGC